MNEQTSEKAPAPGYLEKRRAEVDALLDARLTERARGDDPGRLVEAMRYSLLSPGKRLRPVLGLAAAEAVGAALSPSVRLCTASVELVHCYSLVHDDLPAMDDDDTRRGRLTNHKVFGEATAILAGDALLTLAFQWIAEAGAMAAIDDASAPPRYVEAAMILANAAGMSGMVRGQARDLGEPAPCTVEEAETLHREKTGALFRAAVELGAVAGGARPHDRQALARFGALFGLAFQHADDLADGEHVSFADTARKRVQSLTAEAIAAIEHLGAPSIPLQEIARSLV